MKHFSEWNAVINGAKSQEARACNCIGPQNGNPVCPCMMPAHREREAGKMALEILRRQVTKPRVRVKAGSARIGEGDGGAA